MDDKTKQNGSKWQLGGKSLFIVVNPTIVLYIGLNYGGFFFSSIHTHFIQK